ncbi:MAG: hypothetical protein U9O98_09745 [Asgard group archaeon]|nr:hypothetical protein [Asgard group archaeon]
MKKKNKQSSIEFQDESIAINLQEFFNEITSMLGVEQILLFTKTGETLYSYNRWGEFHRGIEEKEAYNLIDMLIKKIKKITENNSISQTILKTKKIK